MKHIQLKASVALAVALLPFVAKADDTIKTPGDHPDYTVELEPHLLLGWDLLGYGSFGYGAGFRASIPIVRNGFIPKINNSVAITFGGDWLHFENGCYYLSYCSAANYFYFPIAMQWNFFVAKRWSVFAEPGFAPYLGTYSNYCETLADPNARGVCTSRQPTHVSVSPWFSVGGRYHFSEHVALTMRIGYPSFSVGVSFL